MSSTATGPRARRDLCPGVLRPWPAADGALVRIRLVGGLVTGPQLAALSAVAQAYGDGDVHLTGRANLQLRGLPATDGVLEPGIVAAVEATGLLPSRTHELARNIMVSPRSPLGSPLRRVAAEVDRLVCADPAFGGATGLPGRFLVTLDDGSGDLAEQAHDLGLVVLDDGQLAQLRVGSDGWGDLVELADPGAAAATLVAPARRFLDVRGDGTDAPWHVDELPDPSVVVAPAGLRPRDPRTRGDAAPLPFPLPFDARHVEAPGGVLDAALVDRLATHPDLVVTPWRGVLLP